MRKTLAAALVLAASLAVAYAQPALSVPDLTESFGDDSLGLELGLEADFDGDFYTVERVGVSYYSPSLALLALLAVDGDGLYAPGLNIGDNYFLLEAGGMAFTFGDFVIRGGQLPAFDVVDSPYSLFVNGSGRAATLGEIGFKRGIFSYESRWIGLNHRNKTGNPAFSGGYYPERGANLKTYRLDFGKISLGLQDAAVYSGRYFDFDYFVDPMPNYFIQYVNNRSGRPWFRDYEDNDVLGAFLTWDDPRGFDAYAQLLVDDLSALGLLGSWSNNPWKAAWSVGGSLETEFGKFGLYHAGATKYCFEPTYETAGMEYGYSAYPDTVYYRSGSPVAIPFEDSMLGYRHGENNIAFMATWSDSLGGFDLDASCEFTLSGSKSPANAWHEELWTDYGGTRILDEKVLEKRGIFSFEASRPLGDFLVFGRVSLGYVFNELKLVSSFDTVPVGSHTEDKEYSRIAIWKPSGDDRPLYSITLGGGYRFAF